MKYAPADLDKALYAVAKGRSDKDAAQTVKRLMEFMKRKRLLHLLPKMLRQLPAIAAAVDEAEALHIDSSRELSKKEIEAIVEAAGLDPSRTQTLLRVVPELLGGVRLRRKGKVLDASVKEKLRKLRMAAMRSA